MAVSSLVHPSLSCHRQCSSRISATNSNEVMDHKRLVGVALVLAVVLMLVAMLAVLVLVFAPSGEFVVGH